MELQHSWEALKREVKVVACKHGFWGLPPPNMRHRLVHKASAAVISKHILAIQVSEGGYQK